MHDENKKDKKELRVIFNKHNKKIKQCSKCLHKKERSKFHKIKSEEDVGLCEECANKSRSQTGGKGPVEQSEQAKKKAELEANYQIADDNIELGNYEVICTNCKKWINISDIAVNEFTKLLCKDCKDIFVKKDDKVRKNQAKEFNKKYNDIHMCTICYWIKRIEKFRGAKSIAERCDSCRGVVAVTQSNANRKRQCLDCKTEKLLKDFSNGMAGRCNECQHNFDCERWTKANHRRTKEVDEYNTNNDGMRKCKRCLKKLRVAEFNNDNVVCKKCIEGNKKYEATRDKDHKKQVDKERYEKRMREAIAYDVEGFTKCKKCGFEGDTDKYFTTEDGVEIWYCIGKCYDNRQDAERRRKDIRKKGAEPASKLYNIERDANRNNYEWDLNYESAKELLFQDCFYCGSPPTKNQLNSIDAVKHQLGFISGNVVPCCETCNRIKGSIKLANFVKRARHIISRKYPEKYQWTYWNSFPITKSGNYKKYIRDAKKRKITFMLTEKEFESIINKPCHYCNTLNGNGIDRKDSSNGYILNNCVSSCKTCNFMKSDCDYDVFFDKLEKIITNPKLALKK